MTTVRAAGVILFRQLGGEPRFLLLESARHGTWGFPKGKCEPGEELLACARREVQEETGLGAYELVEGFSAVSTYRVRSGDREHEKEVHYFLGEASGGEIRLSEEHASFRWASAAEARRLLQHAQNRQLLEDALAKLGPGAP